MKILKCLICGEVLREGTKFKKKFIYDKFYEYDCPICVDCEESYWDMCPDCQDELVERSGVTMETKIS